MGAQCGEGFLRTDRLTLGDHAFGLLDDNAAIEGVIELIVEDLSLEIVERDRRWQRRGAVGAATKT